MLHVFQSDIFRIHEKLILETKLLASKMIKLITNLIKD